MQYCLLQLLTLLVPIPPKASFLSDIPHQTRRATSDEVAIINKLTADTKFLRTCDLLSAFLSSYRILYFSFFTNVYLAPDNKMKRFEHLFQAALDLKLVKI
jgi:hypothetical protein